MTRPLPTGKKAVNLATGEVRVSKIRRDPPPPKLKEISIAERNELDQRNALVGILVFALAIFVIVIAFGAYSGWTPRQYTIEIKDSE